MPQIIPIRDLKNTSDISELCQKSAEPIFITKNGYGDMVIMSMEVYEGMVKKLKIYSDLEVSERQIAEGKTKDAWASLKALEEKYEL